MSIFNELLPKINEISKTYTKNIDAELKAILECLNKFEEEEIQTGQRREKAQNDKIAKATLQSINEDEDETANKESTKAGHSSERTSSNSNPERPKKRSKHEVDGILSPEQDKRPKRNASVKATTIISKQVNVNLTQKMRREDSSDVPLSARSRKRNDDKENTEPNQPLPVVQTEYQENDSDLLKQEKVSIPPEPMETESLPITEVLQIEVKQEIVVDSEKAMPPPIAPVPKSRKPVQKEKSDDTSEDETSAKRRTTNTKKQSEAMPPPPPPVASARAMRSSTRASARARQTDVQEQPPAETRPKRTRGKKKVSAVANNEPEKSTTLSSVENISATSSPAEKPRPKRTRRGKKAAEKPETEPEELVSTLKVEPQTQIQSPIFIQKQNKHNETKANKEKKQDEMSLKTIAIKTSLQENKKQTIDPILKDIEKILQLKDLKQAKNDVEQKETDKCQEKIDSSAKGIEDKIDALDETKVISKIDMDKTVILPNGVYIHAQVTPKTVHAMNETIVIDKSDNRETIVLEKQQNPIMDATVVIDKGPTQKITNEDNNSLLTDDDSDYQDANTPSHTKIHTLPTSAVKEKVQQFEEMASRVTRTKTRAMAKKQEECETQTPPDKIIKPVLSTETLNKMNSLIFNGKAPQQSNSAAKPRVPVVPVKVPSSTSKLSTIRAEEEKQKIEDARQKREALLEAKRELQKRKREEKMAAAALAREAAEKERLASAHLAAQERRDKMQQLQRGRDQRMKEIERKKLELARKVAETEERRRAEEAARLAKLEEEQRRAQLHRQKQIQEQEAMKKEAAIMAKEIEKRQKEYMEKQKKQRMEEKLHTPLKTPSTPRKVAMEPVYMADGFQFLNSDEDEEPPPRPVPEWSTSKGRKQQLEIQSLISQVHIDRLFSVRVHSPDLRDIFPNIERNRLKRTSSAVWRTPPHLPTVSE